MEDIKYLDIFKGLETEAFSVLKVPFKNKDLIQSVLYLSSTCDKLLLNYPIDKYYNSFMFLIDTKSKVIKTSIGHCTKSIHEISSMNMYTREGNEHTFFLSAGFVLDYFKQEKPKEGIDVKYSSNDNGLLEFTVKDLETLMELN
jgi:hypothetical protein